MMGAENKIKKLEGSWAFLKKHNERNALFLVSSVSLMAVGQAVAKDQKDFVVELIKDGRLRRPTPEELEMWDSDGEWRDYLFPFVIVQPFVFVEYDIEDH